jgi:Telomere resolvase
LTNNITDIIIGVYPTKRHITMTTPIIPTPTEFFNQVTALDEKLAVNQACNALMDLFVEKFTVATISKKLTAYKKPFYTYQHTNPDLNETIETKNGTNTQHIAARLLTLSDEQKQALGTDRNERDNARAGFNKEGDLREIETPGIDITAIIQKSCECLTSIDPHTIASGIINLTGLRANEQNMPARKYPDMDLIEHDMVVIDEFIIGFKGVSKKKSFDDANAYYTRTTLAPAQLIVDAQKRYLASKAVQAIPSDYEGYRKGFQDTFYNRYCELFGTSLSTVEAFDDNGNLTDANGSPHKGRAFYACALRSILKTAKSFNDSASNKYIQLCLAHENVGITIKYLGRYDENIFINPVDINIPTNIKGLGKMTTAPAPVKTSKATTAKKPTTKASTAPKVAPKDSFDIDAFITALDADLQVKFAELMNSESSLTNALIALINTAKQEKSNGTMNTKKISVSDEVAIIVKAIMTYNQEQTLNTNRVVPTFALINKISEKLLDKSMAKKTIDTWIEANNNDLHKPLEAMDIQGGLYNSMWNGKHHRKDMDSVIDAIITVVNRG